MARLTSPSGATVTVSDDKVDGLLSRGFKQVEEPKKTTAKKSSSSKTEK